MTTLKLIHKELYSKEDYKDVVNKINNATMFVELKEQIERHHKYTATKETYEKRFTVNINHIISVE